MRPGNFFPFAGAGLKAFKPVAGRGILAFSGLIGALLAVLTGTAYAGANIEPDAVSLTFLILVILIPPFAGSFLSARTGWAVIGASAGESISLRDAGVALRPFRSHILASAMLSAFLTFILANILGLYFGLFLGAHLFLGPPFLLHAIAIEKKSFVDGWARTKELVRGQALRLFLYLLCITLAIVMVEITVLQLAARAIDSVASTRLVLITYYPLLGVILGAGMALTSAYLVIAYLDVRGRIDDVDIQTIANEMFEDDEEDESEEE